MTVLEARNPWEAAVRVLVVFQSADFLLIGWWWGNRVGFPESRAQPEVNILGLVGASGLTEELNDVLLGIVSEKEAKSCPTLHCCFLTASHLFLLGVGKNLHTFGDQGRSEVFCVSGQERTVGKHGFSWLRWKIKVFLYHLFLLWCNSDRWKGLYLHRAEKKTISHFLWSLHFIVLFWKSDEGRMSATLLGNCLW